MYTLYVIFTVGLLSTVCEPTTITVTSSTCDGIYSISEDRPIYLEFLGAPLESVCKFSISGSVSKRVCSKPQKFDVDCETILEYYKTVYSSSYEPDKWYGCNRKQTDDVCADTSKTLHVVFKNNATSSAPSAITLEFYTKDNDIVSNNVDGAAATTYVIIGVVISVILLGIIATVVVVYISYRRRERHAGTVYRDPQPAVVTPTTTAVYDMQDKIQQIQGSSLNSDLNGNRNTHLHHNGDVLETRFE